MKEEGNIKGKKPEATALTRARRQRRDKKIEALGQNGPTAVFQWIITILGKRNR